MTVDEPEASGDEAARAFEALRAEVAELRQVVEASAATGDYAPTLGTMVKLLTRIEAHPALQMTPQGYAGQVRETVQSVQRSTEQGLRGATGRIEAAANQLQGMLGQARIREMQRKRLLQVGVGAMVAGAALCLTLSGPVARSLPRGWSVPETMAAAMLRESRWDAGAQMMASAKPQTWASVVAAFKLEKAAGSTLEACHLKAIQTQRPRRCDIIVEP